MRRILSALLHLLRAPLLAIVFVVLWVEEWGWRPLAAWLSRLARWPPVARVEMRIGAVSPRVALALFAVPALLLVPAKLAALWLVHEGSVVLGVGSGRG